jgi:hypothetical protein
MRRGVRIVLCSIATSAIATNVSALQLVLCAYPCNRYGFWYERTFARLRLFNPDFVFFGICFLHGNFPSFLVFAKGKAGRVAQPLNLRVAHLSRRVTGGV